MGDLLTKGGQEFLAMVPSALNDISETLQQMLALQKNDEVQDLHRIPKEELFKKLKVSQLNYIHCKVQSVYVADDVKKMLEDNAASLDNSKRLACAEWAGEQYAFKAKYDCDLSYWENIKNLIDEWCEANGENW